MKSLVLDANILIRAVLGRQAFGLIEGFAKTMRFVTAKEAFDDARAYLPTILTKRGASDEERADALSLLTKLETVVMTVPAAAYAAFESEARERLRGRDEDDWPYLALALLLDCPLWTEDRDFFGCGVALWTSDRVQRYLES